MNDPVDSPAASPRPGIKVCGLTSVKNALECVEAGVDWIGLNFHPASPRFVSVEIAASIVAALPASIAAVGLFVDRPANEIREIAQAVGLNLIQLHGNEPVELIRELSDFRIIRAFRLADLNSVGRMRSTLARADELQASPYAVLIDAYVPGLEGGTGHRIDSPILDALPPIDRLILAGGLTPKNVEERVDRVQPWMVDVASGVESTPGIKDPALVRAFVRASRCLKSEPAHEHGNRT